MPIRLLSVFMDRIVGYRERNLKLTIRVRKSLSESKCIVFLSASYNVDLKLCMVIGLTGQLSEDIIIIIF